MTVKDLYGRIPTPAALINLDTVDDNIRTMVEQNMKYGIAHRPHIKPHKCPYLAIRQLELGAQGITCAKLAEAEVMAEAGITDILLAYPLIGEDKWERYGKLAQKIDIVTIVNNRYGAEGLSQAGLAIGKPLRVLIEIDGGTKRGGVKPGEETLRFAESIRDLKGIEVCGLLCYNGTIYDKKTEEEITPVVEDERRTLLENADMLKKAGFKMEILSGGNSFSARYPSHLEGITETRAGNYIFFDCTQLSLGFVKEEQCALRVLATVIAMVDSCHAIIDAGSKSLTSDLNRYRKGYGRVAGYPDIRIPKLNEEHGFVESDTPLPFNVGDKIEIIPNHACVIANVNKLVFGYRQDGSLMELDIAGRAMNY